MNRKSNERDVLEVITDVERAISFTRQGLAVLELCLIAWVLKTISKLTVLQRLRALCMTP